jgi:hypothetical protein
VTGGELLESIDQAVRMIVELDMPDLPEDTREMLIGHLTGAVFVTVDPDLNSGPRRDTELWLQSFSPNMRAWVLASFPDELVGSPLLAALIEREGGRMQTPEVAAAIIAAILQADAETGASPLPGDPDQPF